MRTHVQVIKPRRRVIAVLLSLAATGLGQLYSGRPVRGLGFFLAAMAVLPVLGLVVPLALQGTLVWWVLAALLAYLGIFLAATVDAARVARAAGGVYELRPYNRWPVYVLLVAFSLWGTGVLAGDIRQHVVEPFKIPSQSMTPTILPGDFLLLDKTAYAKEPPRRGDLVIFPNPNNRSMAMLKRIVALPGDTIEVRGGQAYVNGECVAETLAEQPDVPGFAPGTGRVLRERSGSGSYLILVDSGGPDHPRTTVPNGQCFTLGDNRANSMDSREFGPVPLADIKGRVDSLYLPAGSWSRFGALH